MKQGGEWITVAQSDTAYAALYLPLPGLTEFRLVNAESAWAKLEICEVTVYSQGTLPENVRYGGTGGAGGPDAPLRAPG